MMENDAKSKRKIDAERMAEVEKLNRENDNYKSEMAYIR